MRAAVMRWVGWGAAAALLALLAAPVVLAAQDGWLRQAHMLAQIPGGGAPAQVEIRYRLAVRPGIREVPLRGLLAFGTHLTGVQARVGDEWLPVELRSATPPLVNGTLRLPAGVPVDTLLQLTLRYAVEGPLQRDGNRFHVALPVLFVDWRPLGTPENTFVSESRFPADFLVTESFPTVPRARSLEEDSHTYALSLQVVPSFVTYRGRVGDAPLLSPEIVIDAAIVGILLWFGVLAWLRMRQDNRPGSS